MYDVNLINFINTIKDIYSDSLFLNVNDKKLDELLTESKNIINV
jgi:hypothetical protein